MNDVDKLICDCLLYTYQKMDADFYENVFKALVSANSKKIKSVGTCALTIVIYQKKIYVASCGDSEACGLPMLELTSHFPIIRLTIFS